VSTTFKYSIPPGDCFSKRSIASNQSFVGSKSIRLSNAFCLSVTPYSAEETRFLELTAVPDDLGADGGWLLVEPCSCADRPE
ncbi:hypothetical protein BVRB_026140, partial [Beta vulgaris subsp. vulgaris]